MTFIAACTATTVGGVRRAARIEFRTADGGVGMASVSMAVGLADAVVSWASAHLHLLEGRPVDPLLEDLGAVEAEWNALAAASPDQERAAARAAAALITDGLWDLWARSREQPLWKLIVDLSPDQLVRSLDLAWAEGLLSVDQARHLLETRVRGRSAREADLRREGYPVTPTVVLDGREAVERIVSLAGGGWPSIRIALPSGGDLDQLADAVQLTRRASGAGVRLSIGPQRPVQPRDAEAWARLAADLPVDCLVEVADPADAVACAAVRRTLAGGAGARVDLAGGDALSRPLAVKQLLATQSVDICRVQPARLGVGGTLGVLLLAARLRTPVAFVAPGAPSGAAAELGAALHLAAVDDVAIGASLDRRSIDLGSGPDVLAVPLSSSPGRSRLPLALDDSRDPAEAAPKRTLSGSGRS